MPEDLLYPLCLPPPLMLSTMSNYNIAYIDHIEHNRQTEQNIELTTLE